ncbi:hypothetical protein CsatB_009868 [Cannabis sativa]
MLFADDSYLYCRATSTETARVNELLSIFEKASGQQVNFGKSSAFFNPNTPTDTRTRICSDLGILEASKDSKYLGLPSMLGRNKNSVLGYLRDKMQKRIQSWDNIFLSRAGKEVMIKSVVQALPTYAMNVFLLTKDICNQMESLMTRFWWQTKKDSSKGIHWKSWKNLSKHKLKGGMGFRSLRDFNLALLGKQGWRLLINHDSLVGRIFKAHYYPTTTFFNSELGNNPSFIWRSIFEAKHLLRSGSRLCIGSGLYANVLNDPWLPNDTDGLIQSSHPALIGTTVNSLMQTDGMAWDIDILNDLFTERDKNLILQIPLPSHSETDHWYWYKDRMGNYSVKTAYHLLQQLKGNSGTNHQSEFWKALWNLQLPPKVKDFLWRVCSNCLPTKVQLRIKHVNIDTTCPLCNSFPETSIHLFTSCSFAQSCWRKAFGSVRGSIEGTFTAWFDYGLTHWPNDDIIQISMLCWALWKTRNDLIWNKISPSVDKVISSAKLNLEQWKSAQNMSLRPLSFPNDSEGIEQWTKPSHTQLKVNVDGATFAQQNHFGYGFIARDHDGILIEAFQSCKPGAIDAELAEAIGVKEALSWIKRKGWQNVIVETDCINVVHALRSKVHMISPYGSIINESKLLLSVLNNVSVIFVKRSANKVAHFLTRDSYSKADCIISRDSIPTMLMSLILKDS